MRYTYVACYPQHCCWYFDVVAIARDSVLQLVLAIESVRFLTLGCLTHLQVPIRILLCAGAM